MEVAQCCCCNAGQALKRMLAFQSQKPKICEINYLHKITMNIFQLMLLFLPNNTGLITQEVG